MFLFMEINGRSMVAHPIRGGGRSEVVARAMNDAGVNALCPHPRPLSQRARGENSYKSGTWFTNEIGHMVYIVTHR